MTVSPLHPSWLQPHLKRLCPDGSAPARIPAVQENVRQGLQDAQKHEQSCWLKPCCRSARPQKPQLLGAQIQIPSYSKSTTPKQTCTIPISNLTLEPHRRSICCDSTCLQNCTDKLDRTCLITSRISDFSIYFRLCTTNWTNFNQLLIQANNLLICSACNLTVLSFLKLGYR